MEIENKFLAILISVIDRMLPKWEVKAPVPSNSFRVICKQLTKFHETVNTLLPLVSCNFMFLDIW